MVMFCVFQDDNFPHGELQLCDHFQDEVSGVDPMIFRRYLHDEGDDSDGGGGRGGVGEVGASAGDPNDTGADGAGLNTNTITNLSIPSNSHL